MKSINKTTIFNIISTVLLQGISFFSMPILTYMLGTEQYGIYSVYNSWITILTCVMGLNVGSALGVGWYEFKTKYYEFRSSILLFGTLLGFILGIIIIVFINPISTFLNYSYWLIIILIILSLARFVINFVQLACIYEKKAEINLIVSVLLSLLTIGLSVLLIPKFSDVTKYMGRVYGVAIPYFIVAFFMWIFMYAKKPTGLNKEYCSFALMMGVPIVFHSLSQNILSQSDRIMMQSMNISSKEIGIYSFFYTFVAVMSTILGALNNSWCPFYYDDLNEKKWNHLKVKCQNYIELFTILISGFLLLSREVSYLLASKEFLSGVNIIPMLVLAIFFTFMYQFPVNFEFFHKKTKIIAMGTCCAAIINIILNASLIPRWEMYGAAMATAIAYFILFIAHYIIVTHMKEQRYHLSIKVFIPSLVILALNIVLFYWLADMWWIRWGIGFCLGVFELLRIKNRKSIF